LGILIGVNGSTIKEVMKHSGARIVIDKQFPDVVPRKVEVFGSSTEIAIARELILDIMSKGMRIHSWR
jgi:rRNA processing protein Krr1/Pno1